MTPFSFACEVTLLNSCRDLQKSTAFISGRTLRKVEKRMNQNPKILNDLNRVFSDTNLKSEKDFLQSLQNRLRIDYSCRTERCKRRKTKRYLVYAYSKGLIDETSFIFLNRTLKLKKGSKEAPLLAQYLDTRFSIERDLNTIKKHSGEERVISDYSDMLNKKDYRIKMKGIGKLSPRQSLYLKYNRDQISRLGALLIELDKRLRASSSGIYFDFDADGEIDEKHPIDTAEQYRLGVRLLRLELEKLSQSGEAFEGKQITYMDLLAAANELELFEKKLFDSMIQATLLYSPKKKNWSAILSFMGSIAKTALSVIPGVNLVSMLPIIVVESYFESKNIQAARTDKHLFQW
jgi:hypothetical protein